MMKGTIILVESHEGLRANIEELLELEGYLVKVLSLYELINSFGKSVTSAVLVISGHVLSDSKSKRVVQNLGLPTILLSADIDDLKLMPGAKWIPLPFETGMLLEAIKEVLNSTLKQKEY